MSSPPKNNRNRRRSYRNKVNLIERQLPLEVPLFDAKSGLRLPKTVVFTSKIMHHPGWCFNNFETLCGSNYFFICDTYGIETIFRNYVVLSEFDPGQFNVPFDMIYEIARGSARPIMWLLNKTTFPRFWAHPLCEPGIIRLIAEFLKFPREESYTRVHK